MPITILIADDHPVVRQGLAQFLNSDGDFKVVGEASNGAQALDLAHRLRPDVVLMDLVMPLVDGLHATALIRRQLPDVEVIVLSGVLDEQIIRKVIQAGAAGYLLKDAEGADLRRAIKAAAAGQVQLAPQVAAMLANQVAATRDTEPLTEREKEVLRLLAHGESNKAIARSLHVSETTAKTHVSSILGKLGLASRTQAALYAVRVGLVSSEQVNLSGK